MSIIFSFSLAVSITLLIAWGAFRLFCSQADRVSINRLTIIAIYFTSLLLPLTLLLASRQGLHKPSDHHRYIFHVAVTSPDSPAPFRFGFGSFSLRLLGHSSGRGYSG